MPYRGEATAENGGGVKGSVRHRVLIITLFMSGVRSVCAVSTTIGTWLYFLYCAICGILRIFGGFSWCSVR
jgi:hypothetical protein